ncbi:MAG: hypothetical protein ACI9WO_001598 [Sphingobacteriales bacterium]
MFFENLREIIHRMHELKIFGLKIVLIKILDPQI